MRLCQCSKQIGWTHLPSNTEETEYN
uniref:Uncharacterized protein n=1 Tax=Anguilla anguilla TaxID=7936 RepID=A0A0E9PC71_ANGAN